MRLFVQRINASISCSIIMKDIMFLPAIALLASNVVYAQFAIDCVNNLPVTEDHPTGICVGNSDVFNDWTTKGLTFESSILAINAEGIEGLVMMDLTSGSSVQSISVSAFTPTQASLQWSLQTAFLAVGKSFGHKIDSDQTYTMASRDWTCTVSRNSGG